MPPNIKLEDSECSSSDLQDVSDHENSTPASIPFQSNHEDAIEDGEIKDDEVDTQDLVPEIPQDFLRRSGQFCREFNSIFGRRDPEEDGLNGPRRQQVTSSNYSGSNQRRSFARTEPSGNNRLRIKSEENDMFLPESHTERSPSVFGTGLQNPDPFKPSRKRLPKDCICPVGLQCPAKTSNLIDCRTLIIEWTYWACLQLNGAPAMILHNVSIGDQRFANIQQVSRIIPLLTEVNDWGPRGRTLGRIFREIREWIYNMQMHSVTQQILQNSGISVSLQAFLNDANANVRQQRHVPIDIVEDLTIIYQKFLFGDRSANPYRGLLRRGVAGQWRADPNWPWYRSASFFGHGHLVNGQTWLVRAAMRRDGAHAPPRAGISGNKNIGAMSVVMGYHDVYNEDYYADVDCGEVIYYMGTARPGEVDQEATNIKDTAEQIQNADPAVEPTSGTLALKTSLKTGEPVRVFRSFRLAPIVGHKPKKGYRYDGLYKVVDEELLKIERQIWRFKMERLKDGQGPIRGLETTTNDSGPSPPSSSSTGSVQDDLSNNQRKRGRSANDRNNNARQTRKRPKIWQ